LRWRSEPPSSPSPGRACRSWARPGLPPRQPLHPRPPAHRSRRGHPHRRWRGLCRSRHALHELDVSGTRKRFNRYILTKLTDGGCAGSRAVRSALPGLKTPPAIASRSIGSAHPEASVRMVAASRYYGQPPSGHQGNPLVRGVGACIRSVGDRIAPKTHPGGVRWVRCASGHADPGWVRAASGGWKSLHRLRRQSADVRGGADRSVNVGWARMGAHHQRTAGTDATAFDRRWWAVPTLRAARGAVFVVRIADPTRSQRTLRAGISLSGTVRSWGISSWGHHPPWPRGHFPGAGAD
jgi:hypothetical protein